MRCFSLKSYLLILALIWPGLGVPAAFADLLVGSNRTNALLRFDENTGELIDEFVAGGSGGLTRPGGIALGPDGNLYVASNMTDNVLRYSGATGEFIDEFVAAGSGDLHKPSAIVFGPDQNLYVNSQGTNSVLRYDGMTGEFID
ncbi:MAG TPA: hypothetical protein VEM39_07380, partial [Myxococcaceae bacterium]|nr:hypothetical protein [Myxococcaceae bacterium]